MSRSTAEWVSAARAGDRAAFGRLYTLYGRMVHGILLARVPRDCAEDLVQEVFLRALRQLDGLRDTRAFGSWLATIARNAASDLLRSRRDIVELSEEVAAPGSDEVEAREALRAILTLPEAYREPLVLRLVEGMSGPEIALRTGLTPGSVRVNLHRGMRMLREKLGATGKGTGA